MSLALIFILSASPDASFLSVIRQILAMFLTMAVGFGVVRAGLFKTEDSRIISNMVVYICNPCVVVHSFQIELTDDKIKGLMIAIGLSVVLEI